MPNADGLARLDEGRRLLDMQFDKRLDPFQDQRRNAARGIARGSPPHSAKSSTEAFRVSNRFALSATLGKLPRRGTTSDIRDLKPDAFLRANCPSPLRRTSRPDFPSFLN